MGELGELLELLYNAKRSWTTVSASMRQWTHRERSQEAFRQFAEQRRRAGSVIGIRGAGPHEHDRPLPDMFEWRARVWVATPDRVHVEPEGDEVVPIHRRVASVNGQRVVVSQQNPLEHLLDPAGLIGVTDLDIRGRGEVAGRQVLVVEARLREPEVPGPFARHGLSPGADRYLLSVDAERGILLRTEALLAGEPYAVTEITAISFDEELPDELFDLTLSPPEPPAPPEPVRIEDAARAAPFTVMVPTRVPEGSTLSVRLMRAVGPRPFLVSLSYHLPAALHHLQLTESSEGDDVRDGVPWTEERHGDWQLWVWEPAQGLASGSRQVKVVREGTVVRITSDLDLASLREIALSLVPAPTEPPALT